MFETHKIIPLSLGVLLLISVGFVALAVDWVGPQFNPPERNIPPPIIACSACDSRFVEKSGDTMTGILDMDTNRISGVKSPTAISDAVNKEMMMGYVETYVDDVLSSLEISCPDCPAQTPSTVTYTTCKQLPVGFAGHIYPSCASGYTAIDQYCDYFWTQRPNTCCTVCKG